MESTLYNLNLSSLTMDDEKPNYSLDEILSPSFLMTTFFSSPPLSPDLHHASDSSMID